jgi:CheY-like chemotaxis protein
VLRIIQDMLRFKGYRVVAVTDGAEALEAIEKEDFDLVLTDLGMPRISGWDIAKKAKDKNPKLPVVLLTGWGAHYEDEDVSGEGVDIVLSKPLSLEKLMESIGKLL